MRILIDECLPSELTAALIGHEVRTVPQEGWAGLKNGRLLKTISGRFDVFITIDKRIERENKIPDNIAIVTVRARPPDTGSVAICSRYAEGRNGDATRAV